VVLTRTPEDNARLRAALGDLPAEIVDFPCVAIETVPLRPETISLVGARHYSAVAFVSRNAVESFFSFVAPPPPAEIVAIGLSTAQALRDHGWPNAAVPTVPNIEQAVRELAQLFHGSGPVLYVRGDLGEDTLPHALRAAGRTVDVVVVYRTTDARPGKLPAALHPTLITFASPSAVRNFAAGNAVAGQPALAIGETTAGAAREAGFRVQVAPTADVAGMAQAIRGWVDGQLSSAVSAI
jgi:uroporphyrinogen-III synthase